MKYTLIQALRGLLSIGVVLMHIKMALIGVFPIPSLKGDPSFFAFLPNILGGIPCGFFAISGYFMAFLVDRGSPNFLAQRLLRVYPTYFICIGLAFLLRAFTTSPLNPNDLAGVLTLLPLGRGMSYKLGIEWTLVFEVSFYFACAIFCRPKWNKRFPAFLLGWLFVGILANIAAFLSPPVGAPGGRIWATILDAIPYYPPPAAQPNPFSVWLTVWDYSFILGALTFYLLQRRFEPVTMFWTSQVLLFSTAAICVVSPLGYHILYLLGLLAAALIIALISLEKRIRSPQFLAQLGDYSYALYLIHPTLVILVLDRWHAVTGKPPGLSAGLLTLAVCSVAFWVLGRMDLAVHKYCRARLNRAIPKIGPALARAIRAFSPKGTP